MTLVPLSNQESQPVAVLLQMAAGALRGQSGVTAGAGGNRLVITIPFANSGQLAEAHRRLASVLPDVPELALLASVLAPAGISWAADDHPLRPTQRYAEKVDLRPAWEAWKGQADRLDAASRELEAKTPRTSPANELARAQRALWAADAATWRALAADSRAEYRTEIREPAAHREWTVPAGSAQALELAASRWQPDHLRLAAVGAGLLLLSIAIAFWRWA